jgi:hypothetical protein
MPATTTAGPALLSIASTTSGVTRDRQSEHDGEPICPVVMDGKKVADDCRMSGKKLKKHSSEVSIFYTLYTMRICSSHHYFN